MVASIRAEFYKLAKRPGTWFLAGAFVLVLLLFNYLLGYVAVHRIHAGDADLARFQNQLRFHNFSWAALGVVAQVGGPVTLILGALISGSEYGWGTFKTILTQRPSRFNILGGKVVSMAVLMTIFVVAGWIASAIASLIVSGLMGYSVALPTLGSLAGGMAAGWLLTMVWGSAGLALGFIFRSTAMPIGLGLIWGLAAENIIGGLGGTVDIFRKMEHYLIHTNAATLTNAFGKTVATGDVGVHLSTLHAVVVLTAYAVVLLAIATRLFRSRDLT